MIKNRKEILEVPKFYKKRRKTLLRILENVLKELKPEKLTKNVIRQLKLNLKSYENIYVLGVGKASCEMAKAAHSVLGKKIKKGLVIYPKGTSFEKCKSFKYMKASHPIPCLRGKRAAKKLFALAKRAGEKDLVIFLLSGGGSALLPLPEKGIKLKDKIATTKLLIKSNADINEINSVRKHISQLKGGKLARILYPAKTICIMMSDVVGNDKSVIASGPLSADETTFKDAIAVIKKYNLWEKIPKSVTKYLEKGIEDKRLETVKKNDKCLRKVQTKIIADHKKVLDVASGEAKKIKISTQNFSYSMTGEARDIARKLVKENMRSKADLLIATGETTVTVKGKGAGGRNQELALGALESLQNQTIISIGTDGVDGMTPKKVAGAIADKYILEKYKLDPKGYLKENDSYGFFKKAKSLIKTGPTGNNLGDLIMILKD